MTQRDMGTARPVITAGRVPTLVFDWVLQLIVNSKVTNDNASFR
jgi:hypothetical protein